jgi:O-antigen/teichoic acid export membrane protein
MIRRLFNSHTASRVATVFLNNGLRQVLALVISIFVARIYGASGRGEFALFSSIVTLVALVSSLGLVNALVYEVKLKQQSLKEAVMLLLAHSIIAMGLLSICLVLVYLVADTAQFQTGYPFLAIGICLFLYYLSTLLNLLLTSYLLANGDTRNHLFQMVSIPLITLATLLTGYFVIGKEGFHPVFALVAGEFFAAVVFLSYLVDWRSTAGFSIMSLKNTYSYALRSYVSGLTGTVLSKLDDLVVGAYSGVEAVGFYATAKSFYQVVLSVPKAFSGYLFGLFVERKFSSGVSLVLKASGVIFFVTLVVALPLFIAPAWFLQVIYGPEFTVASTALVILAAAAIASGTSNPILGFLNAHNRPGTSSLTSLISMMISVMLLFILVPTMSYDGAAYASLIGAIAMLTMRYGAFLSVSKKA